MACCHFVMGRLDDALQWADRSLIEQPRAVNVMVFKLGVCRQLGLTEEARGCLERLRQRSPGFSIAIFTK